MDIQLFIKDVKADIGNKEEFARNFRKTMQFSDLENPVNIVTDYSYSISLPGTPVNRKLFGFIENGTDPYIFNPVTAYPYRLNVNGVLFSEGNIQLTEIKNTSGKIEFSCTFYSKVHQVIMEMSNKKLKDLGVLQANNKFYHFLDRNAMAQFWFGTHQYSDVIRYVPTRSGFYQNFTGSKMLAYDSDGDYYYGLDLGTDYDEYAMREYRVECQRPALSMDYIMKGISSEFGINVDASLMSSPLVGDSWMMCPQMSQEDKSENITGTLSQNYNLHKDILGGIAYFDCGGNIVHMVQTNTMSTGETVIYSSHITPEINCFSVTFEFVLQSTVGTNADDYEYLYDYESSVKPYINMQLSAGGTVYNSMDGDIYFENGVPEYYYKKAWSFGDASTYHYCHTQDFSGWNDESLIPLRFRFLLPYSAAGTSLLCNIHYFDFVRYLSQYSAGVPLCATKTWQNFTLLPMESLSEQQLSVLRSNGYNGVTITYSSLFVGKSPLYVDMENILGSKEFSCKDFLTDITKMTGCVWDFTSDSSFNIVSRNNYFKDYSILDWTKKLDRTSISYKPIVFNKKVYTMSYKGGDSMLENNYKDSTGFDYGKQYVDTGYAFNDETESLLETKFLNTVQCKGERKCLIHNYGGGLSYITQNPYEVPMIEKKDNGAPNEGFRMLFNCGITELDKGEYVYITQDPIIMFDDTIGGKCWLDTVKSYGAPQIAGNLVQCVAIPKFSTRMNTASWDFAKSTVSYSSENDITYNSDTALYPRFWSKYINALYDAKTRVMTASFNLSTNDLVTFSFRNFVLIDNHLWHVNKLIDFDISGENLTKAELVEVNDLESWVNGQDWDFSIGRNTYSSNTDLDFDASSMYYVPDSSSNENEEEQQES